MDAGRSRAAAVALLAVLSAGVLAGCGSEAPIPDVVGVALDDAHNELKAAGFEEFEDADLFEDRSIFMDSNWVVLEQDPAAGETAGQGSAVTLRVGKIGEDRTNERLPEDSPVLAAAKESVKEAEAAAAQQAKDDAAKTADEAATSLRLLSEYVNSLDPLVRLGNRLFDEMDRTAAGVRSGEYGFMQSDVVGKGLDAVDVLAGELQDREPPNGSKRAGTHEAMIAAASRLREGGATLLSAVDDQKAPSLARWEEVRQDARGQWNTAVAAMYKDSGVAPPLLP